MAACGKCGGELPSAGRFCGLCGAPVESLPSAAAVHGTADTDPLARTAPADPKVIAEIRLAMDAARGSAKPQARAVVAATVNDLVMVPEPGAKVHVAWDDGSTYPGTVKRSSTEQCLVLFPDGQETWVDLRRVTPA